MLLAASVCVVLVGITILIHYEVLRATSEFLPGPRHLGIRGRMILVVFACFLAHTIEVWVYALGFWLLGDELKLVSTVGRLDYARVRIIEGAVEPLAIAGASVLSSTSRADGFVRHSGR